MPRLSTRCTFGVCGVLVAALCTAQVRPENSIREEQTGSHIRQDVARSSIPINLTYAQLSPDDRAAFHANYELIAEGDEPPFPLEGLRALIDPIQKAQEKLFARGDLFLVATIGPDGKAKQVSSYRSPSSEMTKFAAQVLMLTPFKPAICSGKPCTMDFPLKMTFRIE